MDSYEPQIIHFYNELPTFAFVIDKMNQEYDDICKENNGLKKEIKGYKKRNSIHRDKNSCIPIVLILIILTEITILSIYL